MTWHQAEGCMTVDDFRLGWVTIVCIKVRCKCRRETLLEA